MKLNLLLGTNTVLAGHLNLDPTATGTDGVKIKHSLDNLDDVCENSECTNIVAEDIIDYCSSNDVNGLLTHWISKLRHGGTLVVGGNNLTELCRLYNNKVMSLMDFNLALFGLQRQPHEFKQSCVNVEELVASLQEYGLVITKKHVIGHKYIVEAMRP
jgi:hypothetical protein